MHRTCIAVIDATRARLFTFDRTAANGAVHEDLVETADLVNPGRRLASSRGFPYDDHGDARQEEMDRTFAKQIAAEVRRLTADPRARRLVVCASPNMLGEMRQLAPFARDGVAVDEIARDLVKLSGPQIRAQLREYGLLPG
jgi:protein required for attachment to host cells